MLLIVNTSPVNDNDKMIVASLKDSEQPIILVTLYMKREATPDSEKSSVKYQRDGYVDDLVSYMIGERLNEMQDKNPKPCLSASAAYGSVLNQSYKKMLLFFPLVLVRKM